MIHTYYVILGVIFHFFLAQNFKPKVLTAQENQLLECLLFPIFHLSTSLIDRQNITLPFMIDFLGVLVSAFLQNI